MMRAISMLFAAVSGIAIAVPAAAQDAAPAADPTSAEAAAEDDGDIIIVTANKREQSIIDVDSSITAISGDDLAAGGIQDTQALVNATPNLVVQRSVIGKIHIRGIGNENYTVGGDPSVAVHSDGIYVARASAGLFDLFDIERVEVLRGPQGTLYGRNATGGVINVIPRPPGKDTGGYLTAEYGNYDHFRFEGAVNVDMNDGLSARISGMRFKRDGFIKNINEDARSRGFGRLDSKDLYGVRGQVQYDSGAVVLRGLVEYIHDNSNLPAYVYLRQPAPFLPSIPTGRRTVDQGYETLLPILGGPARSFGSDEDIFKSNQFSAGLHIDADIGGNMTLSSVTGYRKTVFNWLNDGDGTSAFFVNYGQQDDSKQFSQEVRLASDSSGSFNWLVGGYFFRESSDTFIALPILLSIFALPDDSITIDGTAKTNALALFGEVYWQMTDRLKLTLGGRYSHEKRRANYIYKALFAGPVDAPLPSPDDDSPGRRTFTNFSPKVVLTYEPNARTNLYASVSRGFKSGGFNLLAIQPGFDPETIWNYEVGAKTRLSGGLQINASAFYSKFKDLQVGQIVNLQSVLTNAAKANIYGLELDVAYRPDDRLSVGAALALLHAEFSEFCTADPTQPAAALESGCSDPTNPINLKGKRLPRAPRMSLSGHASYKFDLGSAGSLTPRLDARYVSKVYFTQFNRPTVAQKGYTTVNGRLTWMSDGEKFSLAAWINNAFDKFYYTEVLESGAFNPVLIEQGYPGQPRTFGLTAGVNF